MFSSYLENDPCRSSLFLGRVPTYCRIPEQSPVIVPLHTDWSNNTVVYVLLIYIDSSQRQGILRYDTKHRLCSYYSRNLSTTTGPASARHLVLLLNPKHCNRTMLLNIEPTIGCAMPILNTVMMYLSEAVM